MSNAECDDYKRWVMPSIEFGFAMRDAGMDLATFMTSLENPETLSQLFLILEGRVKKYETIMSVAEFNKLGDAIQSYFQAPNVRRYPLMTPFFRSRTAAEGLTAEELALLRFVYVDELSPQAIQERTGFSKEVIDSVVYEATKEFRDKVQQLYNANREEGKKQQRRSAEQAGYPIALSELVSRLGLRIVNPLENWGIFYLYELTNWTAVELGDVYQISPTMVDKIQGVMNAYGLELKH